MHVCMYAYMNIRTSCFRDSDLVVEFLSITVFCQIWLKSPEYSNENEYSIRAEMIISIFCLHFSRGRPGDFLCSAWRRWCNIMAQGGQLWPQTYKNWKGKHKKIFKQNTKHKKGKTVVGPFESYHMHTTTGHLHLKLAKSRTKCNCWE